jgi:hypothetical protein
MNSDKNKTDKFYKINVDGYVHSIINLMICIFIVNKIC